MTSKRLVILILVIVMLGGTLTAYGSVHGIYKGFPVVGIVVNDRELQPDVPAIVMDGRTLLPVRAVAEALGAKVEWDQSTYTVKVTLPKEINEEEFLSWRQELKDRFAPLWSEYTSLLEDFNRGSIDSPAFDEKMATLLPKVEELMRFSSSITSSDPVIRESIQVIAGILSLVYTDIIFQKYLSSDQTLQETSKLLHQAMLNIAKYFQIE